MGFRLYQEERRAGDWRLSADRPKASRHAVFTLGYMVHGVFTTLLFALRALRDVGPLEFFAAPTARRGEARERWWARGRVP